METSSAATDTRSIDELTPDEKAVENARIKLEDGDVYGSEFLSRPQYPVSWQVDFDRQNVT